MKNNVVKILTTIITIFLITMLASANVYADPNSSKGFADFDDEDASKQTEELIENQAKAQNEALQEAANIANASVESVNENEDNEDNEVQENIENQNELEQSTIKEKDENKNQSNYSFIIGGIVVLAIIVILIVFIIKKRK